MATNSFSRSNLQNKLGKYFSEIQVNELAKEAGFVKRKSKHITPYGFLIGFLMSCLKKQYSYTGWAIQIGLLKGFSISKQSVFSRIKAEAANFACLLLQRAMLSKINKEYTSQLFENFRRVLVQDSTTLKLPDCLSSIFKGNSSNGKQKSVARIQAVINLKTMSFIHFSLRSFTDNDQSASPSIVEYLNKGDLVIRDLGYSCLKVFEEIINVGANLLSRVKYGTTIYDQNGQQLDWLKLLKKKSSLDKEVLMGIKHKIPVRLVIIPLPAHIVEQRVRKAKKDRDKRLNHSDLYYKWLAYSIYITTVSKKIWSPQEVDKVYRNRWQIEIIFKTWKSNFKMQEMLHNGCGNEHRVRLCIYLLLLFICIFTNEIYIHCRHIIKKKYSKDISIIKLSNFVFNNIITLLTYTKDRIFDLIANYCCYEDRNDRRNMTQQYENIYH
jgi:hypothetical protein